MPAAEVEPVGEEPVADPVEPVLVAPVVVPVCVDVAPVEPAVVEPVVAPVELVAVGLLDVLPVEAVVAPVDPVGDVPAEFEVDVVEEVPPVVDVLVPVLVELADADAEADVDVLVVRFVW